MDVKISVVLPVYNVADYLRKCLDSLVSQTFKDFEVMNFKKTGSVGSIIIKGEQEKVREELEKWRNK